jgi:hypothetical protein
LTQIPFKKGPAIADIPKGDTPKRRGRPPGSKNKSSRNLKKEIGGTLTLMNMGFQIAAPRDALDPIEIEALALAIDEECKKSPTFRKYVEFATRAATGGGSLLGVVAIIGARRAARHGVIPPMFDDQLGSLLAMTTGKAMPQTNGSEAFDFGATVEVQPEESPLD